MITFIDTSFHFGKLAYFLPNSKIIFVQNGGRKFEEIKNYKINTNKFKIDYFLPLEMMLVIIIQNILNQILYQ